jgi:aspartate/glutamate racemase
MESVMKTIGIIGGMSCQSTALYYNRLNAEAQRRLGGLHSAECVIWSVDFARIESRRRATGTGPGPNWRASPWRWNMPEPMS